MMHDDASLGMGAGVDGVTTGGFAGVDGVAVGGDWSRGQRDVMEPNSQRLGHARLRRQPGEERHLARGLQEVDHTTSTAEFEVFFLNDPTETVAAGRGVDASVKLLEGQEVKTENKQYNRYHRHFLVFSLSLRIF